MTPTADEFADLSHMAHPAAVTWPEPIRLGPGRAYPVDAEESEVVAALVRELAAVRLALLNTTTERDAAHAEVAELRAERSAVMAAAFTTATADVTPTSLSIFP